MTLKKNQLRNDLLFWGIIILALLPFFLCNSVYSGYKTFNHDHGYIMAFIKFGILATLGEIIGLRIRKGHYYEKGFGIVPRAITWGCLGIIIKMSFVIFGTGAPIMLKSLGIHFSTDPANLLSQSIFTSQSWFHVLIAFTISATMNTLFAPIFMTLHKITDEHIQANQGTIKGFFTPIKFGYHMKNLNWEVMWNFVFKKTIPFFWIPAHTITFLLPPEYRILNAAVLGVVLGILMAFASMMSKEK